jgi:hypothetical protein
MTAAREKPSPIEVWLRQRNLSVSCKVVHADESTEELEIDSLSMRGAQREITGSLIKQGYKPDGRWAAVRAMSRMARGPRRRGLITRRGAGSSSPDTTAQRPDKPQGWA